MTESFYVTNRPTVAAENFEDEAVVIHMDTGVYYSLQGSAGLAWQLLESGASPDGLTRYLAVAYQQDPTDVAPALERFLADLHSEGLIRPAEKETSLAEPEPRPGEPYQPPALVRYEDLQDLLLIDPIHEVDEDLGWPSAKPDSPEG